MNILTIGSELINIQTQYFMIAHGHFSRFKINDICIDLEHSNYP